MAHSNTQDDQLTDLTVAEVHRSHSDDTLNKLNPTSLNTKQNKTNSIDCDIIHVLTSTPDIMDEITEPSRDTSAESSQANSESESDQESVSMPTNQYKLRQKTKSQITANSTKEKQSAADQNATKPTRTRKPKETSAVPQIQPTSAPMGSDFTQFLQFFMQQNAAKEEREMKEKMEEQNRLKQEKKEKAKAKKRRTGEKR